MKIDVFAHFLPQKYFQTLKKKIKPGIDLHREENNKANNLIDVRLRVMDRYPDVIEILTVSQPPLEVSVSRANAIELAKMANDELTEIVLKYPDKFIAGVACLPMNDIDAAVKEADRACNQLRFKGVQIYSNIAGETLDSPKFRPLWEKMVELDLPIWIHPTLGIGGDEPLFGWPHETSQAMRRLVFSGVMSDYPNIKFITHHCGAMVSFFERRIKWLVPLEHKGLNNAPDLFRKFYCDTAVYGSVSAIKCAYDFFGPEHIMFGTDTPLGPGFGLTMETIHSIEKVDIPAEDKEKIFEQNAVNLLRMAH